MWVQLFVAIASLAAWRGIASSYHPETGLFDASAGYAQASPWEMGGAIAATVAAYELRYIERAEYEQRITRLLRTLQSLPLVGETAFGRSYSTINGQLTSADFSAIQNARLLIWLRRLSQDPVFRSPAEAVVARLKLTALTQGGYLRSGNATSRYQDGRIGYEQYAAAGFQLWGVSADSASDLMINARSVNVGRRKLLADRRGHDRLTSEPFVLYGMELGLSGHMLELAQNLLALQQDRFATTGKLTAANADAVNRPPDYYYTFCVYCDGYIFLSFNGRGERVDLRWLSTSAAYGWNAILPSDYTRALVNAVRPALDETRGWSSGILEDGNGSTGAFDLNTASIILEAAAYIARGRPLISRPTAGPPTSL